MSQEIEELLNKQASKINSAIEKYIPREFEKTSTVFALNPPLYAHDLEVLNKTIADPIWEFLDRGGKRWRPALFLLVCEALGKNPEDFLDFALIPEVIHNGTLMIDDIEDSSELRRGKPCTYRIFGTDIAINAGNAMYFLPLLSLIKKGDEFNQFQINSLYEIFIQEMISLSLGQAMDIAWHRGIADADKVTEENYLQMCAYKTGTLVRMAARMAAVVAGASTDLIEKLGKFAEAIGIAFQMQDDILDLSSNGFAGKKGARGMDITEGKRSLIVIHTLEKSKPKERKRLIEILNSHTNNQKLRDEAIAIMNTCGSIEYTKRFAKRLVRESWSEVNRLLPRSEAKEKLNAFATYLIERKI
jgi:geranylgeranyl pyrophosphate synthase